MNLKKIDLSLHIFFLYNVKTVFFLNKSKELLPIQILICQK